MTEQVILVDEKDQILGTREKLQAHEQALCHRAFSVFIFRERECEIELLLQRRHPEKYHCGGLWTNTCCSHPRPGEEVVDAGLRRLQEEMGVNTPLQKVGHFYYRAEFENGLTEHEYDHVLLGFLNDSQEIIINPQEVIEFKWIGLSQLNCDLEERASQYTPWFRTALDIALEELCNVGCLK